MPGCPKRISFFVSCVCPLRSSGRPRRTLLMVAPTTHGKRKERRVLTLHTLPEAPRASFEDFPVSGKVRKAVADQGWEVPTPIQELALPALLDGEDVVGLAQTGSGKTARSEERRVGKECRSRWSPYH